MVMGRVEMINQTHRVKSHDLGMRSHPWGPLSGWWRELT